MCAKVHRKCYIINFDFFEVICYCYKYFSLGFLISKLQTNATIFLKSTFQQPSDPVCAGLTGLPVNQNLTTDAMIMVPKDDSHSEADDL